MKIKNKLQLWLSLSAIFMAFSSAPVVAQTDMPVDPELRKGVLDNGITYYIRHNEEPKERASFYIIQNVGALLEEDEQNGLAHFLEHMAFNGTENFEGKGIINTLQKNGVEFGRNLNAYTSLDETVYNISEVPTTTEGLLDTCLLILHDWCNYLQLTEEEIDAERGVITEEWRTRRTARSRMFNERIALMMKDSKYTERDVIGSLDVIQNHDYETLRNFYHDWYRTDLQAIAVVGDFDVDEMEAKVKELFSPIPAVENPKERYYVEVPFNEEPIFGLVTDKEATGTSVNVTFKHKPVPKEERGMAYYRLGMIRKLYEQMLSQRIDEIMQQENPPFTYGYSTYFEYVNNLDVYYIEAGCKKNEEAVALTTLMTENERVRRHGFTAGELERAKMNYMTHFESSYKQRDKISNDKFAKEYARNYLENEPIPGIAKEWEIVQEFTPTISVEEINALAKEWISYENMVVIVSGPEGEGIEHLSEEQAFGIINEVRNSEIEAYEDEEVATTLMTKIPKGSKLKKTKELPVLKAEEWTLKNGIKVIYRFSDIEKDRIYLSAQSKGGSSLYDLEDLPSAEMMSMVGNFGLSDFDPNTLSKMLAGKKVKVSPYLGEISEGISGNASPKDAETLFQMLYLSFMDPRFDETVYASLMQQYSTYLENKKNDPKSTIKDSISLITTGHHPRTLLFNQAFLDKVSLEKIEKIYRERFANAADFTFYISGNITKEEVLPFVETYIGGLNTAKGSEKWVDNGVEMPDGVTKKEVTVAMETPKSTVSIKYGDAKMAYSPENILYAKLFSDVLDLRYTEKVREEEGGTYGVGVWASMGQFPESEASLQIKFDCDPEKAKHLTTIIYSELEKIAKEGPTQEDLDKAVVTSKKNRATSFEKNNFWISAMRAKYWRDIDMVSTSYHEDIVADITPEDIQKFAAELLEKADVVEIMFFPEEKE